SIQVLSQKETPGLGTRIEEAPARETWIDKLASIFGRRAEGEATPAGPLRPPFQVQFDGLGRDDLRLARDGGSIEAITGATISSRAVLDAVKRAVATLEEALAAQRGS
ncbi:MAG: FMN-binding protein, partial [Planctomycetes bacterium]|nr:FMN-binding protein [Planctomycetota bacterium]